MRQITSTKKTPSKKKDDHPFFCHQKSCRKTAWNTPEYLSQSDRDLVAQLSQVTDAEQFADIVFEFGVEPIARKNHDEAFFWRIVGWPEGRHYMRNEEYRKWAFPQCVLPLIQRAVLSISGLNKLPFKPA